MIRSNATRRPNATARRLRVVQPVRSVIPVSGDDAFFATMPAYVRQTAQAHVGAAAGEASPREGRAEPVDREALGAKLVTVFGSNAARGLHSHLASIVLLDPETGALQAVMDGRYITEARTAAVSAASAKHLARPEIGRAHV